MDFYVANSSNPNVIPYRPEILRQLMPSGLPISVCLSVEHRTEDMTPEEMTQRENEILSRFSNQTLSNQLISQMSFRVNGLEVTNLSQYP